MTATVLTDATTAGGYLLVLAIILPVTGILLSLVLGGRYVERIALIFCPRVLPSRSRSSRSSGAAASQWFTL